MPRRKEIRSKLCVVAKVHIISIETWSRRMENGLKVCVVTLVKRGRYDDETMHVHHVIAKPGPDTPLRSPALPRHCEARQGCGNLFKWLAYRIVVQIATSLRSSQ